MNRIVATFALVFTLQFTAVPKTRVDYKHSWDYSRYQTYSWAGPPQAEFLNQLMQQRVMGFVEEALAARRLKRVPSGGDLLVNFTMDVREDPVFTTMTNGFGGWDWGSSISTTTTQVFLTGRLTVDIVDARHSQLIFQGSSTASISSRPERNTKRLSKAVNEIFKKYPPQ